ncbi:nuclear transport factor 2 family protein [Saccharopolyspora gloriosae]|uniref:nuclear transport factor 2 family protein n=1 Tax=Saccharopolyspora gloriosae TaxID=455344 RepID=UPI001FB77EDE|nr:nuclear transport factor 2 family protein [Saccharopolyspora gloriosae]
MPVAEVRAEIEDLLARYALGYDEGDLDLLADCFTTDAVMSIEIDGAESAGPFHGRDAIVDLVRETARSQSDRRRHVITNLVLEQAGDQARARNYLTLFAVADGALRAIATGSYLSELRRTEQGWRLTRLRIRLDLPY